MGQRCELMLRTSRWQTLLRIALVAAIAAFAMAVFVNFQRGIGRQLPSFVEYQLASTMPIDVAYRLAVAAKHRGPAALRPPARWLEEICVMAYERLAYQPASSLAGIARAKLAVIYGERGFPRQAREMASQVPHGSASLVRAAVLIAWAYGEPDTPQPPDIDAALADLRLLDPWFARLCELRVARRLDQTDRAERLRAEIKHAETVMLSAGAAVAGAWGGVLVAGLATLLFWLLRWLFTPTPEVPVRPAPMLRPWQALDAIELAAVMMALVVTCKIAVALAAAHLPAAQPWRVAVDVAAYLVAAGAALAWIGYRLRGQPRGAVRLLGLGRPLFRGLLTGFFAYAAVAAAAAATMAAFFYLSAGVLLSRDGSPIPTEALRQPWAAAVYALLAVAIAPVLEETIFRGFIYAGLRRKLSPAVAAGISALFFAAAHVGLPSAAKVGVGLLAVVLAIAYERTRNLWVSIGMHMTHNALVFALLLLAAL